MQSWSFGPPGGRRRFSSASLGGPSRFARRRARAWRRRMASEEVLLQPHNYPGRLIIVEGIDGSGKTTQIMLLHRWLRSLGQNVFFTEWNSAELVRSTTRRGKKSRTLTPTTFSLL